VSSHRDVNERLDGSGGEADEDARLVALALGGAGDAFDALARRYQRRVVSVAYRLLSNIEDASDVGQEALLRAYRNLGQLSEPRRFGPWLMRIVTNLSLNYRRSRKSSATVRLDEDFEGASTGEVGDSGIRGEAFGPMGEASARELEVRAAVAIAELPEKQRLALILSSVEGVPQKEVAEVLDCSVELVKWNVFQARKALKQALARHLPAEMNGNE